MGRTLPLLVLLAVGGCVFDRSGVPSVDGPLPAPVPLDLAPGRDQRAPDGDAALPDGAQQDAASDSVVAPDAPPDAAPVITPITAAALGAAWGQAQVPCVEPDGTATGQQIPIVDSTSPKLYPGTTCLAGASQDTLTWVNNLGTACILWDLNACGGDEKPGDSNWDTAGLIVRRAALDGQGQLVLEASTATTDINLVNINADGSWQAEFAQPDDSELATSYKQLVNPVAEAKKIVIQLGK